jgi:hypothetical protein
MATESGYRGFGLTNVQTSEGKWVAVREWNLHEDELSLQPSRRWVSLEKTEEGDWKRCDREGCAICAAPVEAGSIYCGEPCREQGSVRESAGRSVLAALKRSVPDERAVLSAVSRIFVKFVGSAEFEADLTSLREEKEWLGMVSMEAGNLAFTLSELPDRTRFWCGVRLAEVIFRRAPEWELEPGYGPPEVQVERLQSLLECLKEAGQVQLDRGRPKKKLERDLVTSVT